MYRGAPETADFPPCERCQRELDIRVGKMIITRSDIFTALLMSSSSAWGRVAVFPDLIKFFGRSKIKSIEGLVRRVTYSTRGFPAGEP